MYPEITSIPAIEADNLFLRQAIPQPNGQLGVYMCFDQQMDCKTAILVTGRILETIKAAYRLGCVPMQLISHENMEWFDGEKLETVPNSRGNVAILLFSGVPPR